MDSDTEVDTHQPFRKHLCNERTVSPQAGLFSHSPLLPMLSRDCTEHQEAAMDGLLSAGCPVGSGPFRAGFIVQYQSAVLLLRFPGEPGPMGKGWRGWGEWLWRLWGLILDTPESPSSSWKSVAQNPIHKRC